jgi:hypothetical protein
MSNVNVKFIGGLSRLSNKRKGCVLIFLSIIAICAIIIISCLISFKLQKQDKINNAKVAMEDYLTQEGFDKEDYILSVDYSLQRKLFSWGGYKITVIYNDEPDVIYGYVFSNGKITNMSVVNTVNAYSKNFKHEN